METIEERKRIPITNVPDVIVAGAGVAGVFAALASARKGMRTLLIDRFGTPGGNIGPRLTPNPWLLALRVLFRTHPSRARWCDEAVSPGGPLKQRSEPAKPHIDWGDNIARSRRMLAEANEASIEIARMYL